MKLSIAIAASSAAPSAFVVWRGFESAIHKAQEYGYHGVELALRSAEEFEREGLNHLLLNSGVPVSCISTGQVFAAEGLYFTHESKEVRLKTVQVYRDLIAIAADHGKIVNIGRARGFIAPGQTREKAEDLFEEGLQQILPDAQRLGVTIVIEPVNRYEINFLNSVDEAAAFAARMHSSWIGVMPDVFHMNIEDDDISKSLYRNREFVKYVHLADSNRSYPGCGHLIFESILNTLKGFGYNGWCSVEILPKPDPDTAAREAAKALKPLLS
jgi:sugar phosphate isomerase/epimerase